MDTQWMAEGNCRSESPSVFFPSDGVGVEVARRICADCPVKEPCLRVRPRQRHRPRRVWGGASERERRRIARRRRLDAAAAAAAGG